MAKFALTGTYCARNKGDAAMQMSMSAALAARGGEVTILAPFAADDRVSYAPMPLAQCDRRNILAATFSVLAAAFGWRSRDAHSAMATTRSSDAVIDLSGDMLTEDYGPHVAWSHYLPILRALVQRRPYFICAQSIGPFHWTRAIARFLLNRAQAVTVRDAISHAYLLKIGVRPEVLQQTADMAFLLPCEADGVPAKLRAMGIDPERPILGVSVSRLVGDKFDRQEGRPGAFLTLMRDCIDAVAQRHDLQVLLTPHVTGPSAVKDDRIVSRELAAMLAPALRVAVIEEDLRPQAIKGFISQCSLFVGTRMHANIAALSSHVPIVAIAYSHKTPGIMRACDVEDYALPFAGLSAAKLTERLSHAYAHRAEVSARLAVAVAGQRQAAMRNVDIAFAIARGEPVIGTGQ